MAQTSGDALSSHEALLYRDRDELVGSVAGFVAEAHAQGRAVLLALPSPSARAVRDALPEPDDDLVLVDMAEVGRNPARLMSEFFAFVDGHGGRPVAFVGEPAWPGRTSAELAEVARHEALVNVAVPAAPVRSLCPYDATRLDATVIADATATHPFLHEQGIRRENPDFADPIEVWRRRGVLEPAPSRALVMRLDLRGLGTMRQSVADHALVAGIDTDRVDDLLVAASEMVGNAVRHGHAHADLRLWTEPSAIVVEVTNEGEISDPLAGRIRPDHLQDRGWGLWLINQLVDLAQLDSRDGTTTVRVRLTR